MTPQDVNLPALSAAATEWDQLLYRALWYQFRLNMERISAIERTLGMTSGKGGWIKRKLTVQTTATYTVLPDDYFLFANAAVTTTYTLPVMEIGRELWFRTAQSAMVAASANVIALAGTPTGTAILPATPGKWALLVNIGDYVGVDLWAICAGN